MTTATILKQKPRPRIQGGINFSGIKEAAARDPESAYRAAGYSGELKRDSRNLVGLCPFHAEKTPSLNITLEGDYAGVFKCFGCGASGSIIDFYLQLHDLELTPDVAADLARALGVEPQTPRSKPRERRAAVAKRIVYPLLDASGKVVAKHVRLERADGSKDFAWERNGKRGLGGLPTADLPLYRLPDLLGASTEAPVVVTEGEKAADALTNKGLLAVGSVTGAASTPGEASLRPLVGRGVILWPDNDAVGRGHMNRIAARLAALGTAPRMVAWQDAPEHGDAADFAGTAEELQALLAAAQELTSEDLATAEIADRPEKVPAFMVADAICETEYFATDAGGKLHVFDGGRYSEHGQRRIDARTKRLLLDWQRAGQWTSHKAQEVGKYILADCPDLWEAPPTGTLNLANGLLDVQTSELKPHRPDFFSPVQLPVRYAPDADCPAWRQFIAETFPEDAQELPWQLAAWLMLPHTSIQKAALLLGAGNNGKSTFLAALIAFLGRHNCAGVSLHRLEIDRFATARLIGKLANICPDLPSAHLAGTSQFKAITGGDRLLAECKYADSFEFEPYCRLVFSANHPPQSSDSSDAFFRRWLVVPFESSFEGRAVPRAELDARLADPAELSGVLNMALKYLPQIYCDGIVETPSMKAAWAELRDATDPVAVWLERMTVADLDAVTPKRDLQRAYSEDCQANGRPLLTTTAFGLALKRARPELIDAQRTVGGKVVWCWVGIGLKSTAE